MATLHRQPGDDYRALLTVDASADPTFTAISTVEGIRHWWTELTDGAAEPGGTLRLEFSRPVKIMQVEDAVRPELIRWTVLAESQKAEWVGTTLRFDLVPAGEGGTEVSFAHVGLRPEMECWDVCSAGWDYVLRSLGSYVETGVGQPYHAGQPYPQPVKDGGLRT
jgi:uncharacterized protein YndB with AHSA1/START domain